MKFLGSRFVRNAAVLQVGGAMNAGFNFVASVGLAYVLGARQQGAWIVANTMYSLVFLMASLGLVQVTVTQIASASARGNVDKVGGWLGALLKGYLVLGLALFVAGGLVLPELVHVWGRLNPDVDPRLAQWAWWLLLTPLLDVPRVVAIAALQGTRRMLRMAQVENVGELLRTFLVVTGAILTGDPTGPVIGTLVGTAIASTIAMGLYAHASGDGEGYPLPSIREIAGHARDIPFTAAYRQGFRFGLIRLTDALGMKILPPLILQTFSTTRWVAYLRISQAIMNLPLILMQGVGRTALPALSELRGTKDHARFRQIFTRASVLGGGLISVGVLVALPLIPLVTVVLPPDYRRPVWLMSCILSFACVMQSFSIALDSFYLLTNKLRVLLRINLSGLVYALIVMVLCTWSMPRYGAAFGMAAMSLWGFVHFAYIRWCFRHDPELAGAVPSAAAS